ncbi:MAG TPA: hypothetical protein VHG92_08270 [Afifellaceae bacterium]|nr:hypothetical protein [Afifellaceae bacterium]
MRHALAAAGLAALLALPAGAQEVVRDGRYSLVPHDDGFLRLDTATGEVSRCTGEIGRLACRLLPDERMAYEAEIRRLEDRIDVLERRMAALEVPTAPRGGRNAEPRAEGPDGADDLPSEDEVDRVFGLAEQMMRRLFDMARDLREEYGPERNRP